MGITTGRQQQRKSMGNSFNGKLIYKFLYFMKILRLIGTVSES